MKLRYRISLSPALLLAATLLAFSSWAQSAAQQPATSKGAQPGTWYFAVSGDSRNCGDVVMPAIAAGVHKDAASFYWHLGDFRAIYNFDEDMQHEPEHIAKPLNIAGYLQSAWDDFIQSQLIPFGATPVYLGLGNHDTVSPMNRDAALIQFADWFDTPTLQRQRLADDPRGRKLKTYYRWIINGVDFITLDNATDDQFDTAQINWFEKELQADSTTPDIHTIVVGMHEALPESISEGHSMNQSIVGVESGRRVYLDLLKAQNVAHKRVYVLASHSHYFMDGIFNTEYWRTHGGLLPGWIVGTAGAVRYALPPNYKDARVAETSVYGYLLGTVRPGGEIDFGFRHVNESDVPQPVTQRLTPEFVHWCFAENTQAK
jgi:hypothetical protein